MPLPNTPVPAEGNAEEIVDYLNSPGRDGAAGDIKLFYYGVAGVGAMILYYAKAAKVDDLVHLYLGLLILFLGALPALMWAKARSKPFPIFEAFMLTTINAYAVPLLSGHQQLGAYPAEIITWSAAGVLLFQGVAIFTYNNVKAAPRRTRFWSEPIVTAKLSRYLAYGMSLTTIYTLFSIFYRDLLFKFIPYEAEGVLRAAFFGIGIVATFLTARRWGAGTLPQSDKTFFTVNFLIQFILQCASLFLVGGISLLVLALLGYISASRRLPILLLVLTVPLLAVLHNGKSTLRAKYWGVDARPPGLTELPAFYSEWVQEGLKPEDPNEKEKKVSNKLLERTSLFHIMCLVVSYCPERQPFLYGETYQHIPGQFVPRFFWANKPLGHVSTYRLSRYFGLQSEEDTKTTTIGFGMLAEAYANFGFYGIAGLAVVFAGALRKVTGWGSASPLVSYGGLLLVVMIAWSFQIELTLSIWISSLFQACVAVLGVPLFLRSFAS